MRRKKLSKMESFPLRGLGGILTSVIEQIQVLRKERMYGKSVCHLRLQVNKNPGEGKSNLFFIDI